MNTGKRLTFRDVVYNRQYKPNDIFPPSETVLRSDVNMTITKAVSDLELFLSRADQQEVLDITKEDMLGTLFHEYVSVLIHTISQDPTLCERHIPTLSSLQRTLKTFLPKRSFEDQPLPKPSWNRSDDPCPSRPPTN